LTSRRPAVATVNTPSEGSINEPDPPIEANPVRENAPNEANSDVRAPSLRHPDGHNEIRIDTPHLGRRVDGFGITGKQKVHPAFHRLQTGRGSTLLDLSAIFDR
jgi:hypothetical protein